MAAGVEFSDLSWPAIGVAMLVNIVLGFVWYSPKTPMGKVWMKGVGMSPDHKPDPKKMMVSMALMVIGTFLLMFVFSHNIIAYRDSYRLDDAGYDLSIMDGLMGGFFTWLGFFLPMSLAPVMWEEKSWGFALNNSAYYLITMVLAGIIMVALG